MLRGFTKVTEQSINFQGINAKGTVYVSDVYGYTIREIRDTNTGSLYQLSLIRDNNNVLPVRLEVSNWGNVIEIHSSEVSISNCLGVYDYEGLLNMSYTIRNTINMLNVLDKHYNLTEYKSYYTSGGRKGLRKISECNKNGNKVRSLKDDGRGYYILEVINLTTNKLSNLAMITDKNIGSVQIQARVNNGLQGFEATLLGYNTYHWLNKNDLMYCYINIQNALELMSLLKKRYIK